MHLYPSGDAIRVQTTPRGQPRTFVWRGHTHRVDSVEEQREHRLDWWVPEAEVHRNYYLLITHAGLICEIYRDLVGDGWYLARTFD